MAKLKWFYAISFFIYSIPASSISLASADASPLKGINLRLHVCAKETRNQSIKVYPSSAAKGLSETILIPSKKAYFESYA